MRQAAINGLGFGEHGRSQFSLERRRPLRQLRQTPHQRVDHRQVGRYQYHRAELEIVDRDLHSSRHAFVFERQQTGGGEFIRAVRLGDARHDDRRRPRSGGPWNVLRARSDPHR